MNTIKKYSIATSSLLFPLTAFAQNAASDFIERLSDLLNQIIPFLILIATVVFLWGVLKWITAGGDEEKRAEGRAFIINGIIGLAIMIGVWGFVNILINFVFPEGTNLNIPGPGNVPIQPR